ncbi:SAM-dependent methyltransferase [Candidatus Latescibacterota bacterium]
MSHVCPWQHVWTFDNVFRGLFHNHKKIFGRYVQPGMTVLDVGCGAGFTSIGLARMVGEKGRIISVDLQQEMLDKVQKRSIKAGLADRIQIRRCEADTIGVEETVDFVNAFWIVHEVPDNREFMKQIYSCLKPGGNLLVAEPKHRVSSKAFKEMVDIAKEIDLNVIDEPRIAFSRSAVFQRSYQEI